ncbi:hypothetical protein C8R27_1094 [Nitrosomonas ureae]|uniref:hypothetical protein n=1 Tax=Nitrosomonas ureae TaxID=44577 RepID=UPI000D76FDBE|nr:hypothetical protein [Nitrosomonas ureae]PXX15591.1 hypothetical protein C8R27_1094 [Nitrosomonas ureae]
MNKKSFKYYGILIFLSSLLILKINISSAQQYNPYTGNSTIQGGLPFPPNYRGQAAAAENQLNSSRQHLESLKSRDSSALNNQGKVKFKLNNSINPSDVFDNMFQPPLDIKWKHYFIGAIKNYENRALNTEWEYNLMGATAVFIPTVIKIYHNIEIPPGFSFVEYFNSLNNAFNQAPNSFSDSDAQQSYYILIGCTGVLERMEFEAQQSSNIDQLQLVRQFAGNLFRDLLKLNPDSYYFSDNNILVK